MCFVSYLEDACSAGFEIILYPLFFADTLQIMLDYYLEIV
jgi:hypothetical protein